MENIDIPERIKLILTKEGYINIEFDEYLYDLDDDDKIIAYNFNVNKDENNLLVSVEITENSYLIWEYLGDDQWWFINEIER